MTASELSKELDVSRATVNQHLDELKAMGAIEKIENEHFKRLKYYKKTIPMNPTVAKYVLVIAALVVVCALVIIFYRNGPVVAGGPETCTWVFKTNGNYTNLLSVAFAPYYYQNGTAQNGTSHIVAYPAVQISEVWIRDIMYRNMAVIVMSPPKLLYLPLIISHLTNQGLLFTAITLTELRDSDESANCTTSLTSYGANLSANQIANCERASKVSAYCQGATTLTCKGIPVSEIQNSIVDRHPFTELYFCPNKITYTAFNNSVSVLNFTAVNAIIDSGQLKTECKEII